MLKFNTFPPNSAGDVCFSRSAEVAIDRAVAMLDSDSVDVRVSGSTRLHAYGESVGHTLIANLVDDDNFAKVAQPLAERHLEIGSRILTAWTDEGRIQEEGGIDV